MVYDFTPAWYCWNPAPLTDTFLQFSSAYSLTNPISPTGYATYHTHTLYMWLLRNSSAAQDETPFEHVNKMSFKFLSSDYTKGQIQIHKKTANT